MEPGSAASTSPATSGSTKSQFEKWKFAGSLPAVLVLCRDYPPLPCGAAAPGYDVTQVDLTDHRILLRQIGFITPKLIHGLLHYDSLNQLFFFGYECQECNRIFLVPDSVESEVGLARALRHKCMEAC
jgi:hypothetical protein